jgi:hypothetical protein
MRTGNILVTIGVILAAALLIAVLVVDARNADDQAGAPADPTQQAYVAEVEAQLSLWREELAELAAQVEVRGDEELMARIEALAEQLDLAESSLVKIRLDAEDAWQDFRQELDTLLADIGAGLIELRLQLEREIESSWLRRVMAA